MPIRRAPSYGTEAASAAPMPDEAPEIQTTIVYASTCGSSSGGVSGANSPVIARAWISSKLAPAGVGLGHAIGVDELADRVLVELRALAHERARLRPVAEVVDLQLDVVAVRVAVVVRERHPVIEAERRHDPGLLEPQVAGVELVEAVVLERRVVQPRARVLAPGRRRSSGTRSARSGGWPRRWRATPRTAYWKRTSAPTSDGVPVDHLLQPGGLEVDVVELGVDDGVSGHRR